MTLSSLVRVCTFATLTSSILVGTSALSLGQQPKASRRKTEKPQADASRKGSFNPERASGVILKVQKIEKTARPGSATDDRAKVGAEKDYTHRLTINLDAVWRDWSRDQVSNTDSGPASKDAAKGANSVATKGEPVDANNMVVVDVTTDTRVETRFRSPGDESSLGSKTPEPVKSGSSKSQALDRTKKPVRFGVSDLKPGLFVEVEYRHVSAQNPASTVTVIRPISGTDTPVRAGNLKDDRR